MSNQDAMQAFKRRGGACGGCDLPIGRLEAERAVALAETRTRKDAAHHRLMAVEMQLESLGFNLREPLWGVHPMAGLLVLFCAPCLAKNVAANPTLT